MTRKSLGVVIDIDSSLNMKSPANQQNGIIAILDALGAANYSEQDIKKFLKARENVLSLLGQKIANMPERIRPEDVDVFTFNDTILIAYKTNHERPNLGHISTFFMVLRKFFVDSLSSGILFRGSVGIGTFFVEDESNTVMGQAVTDAAAWYDKADWIGIQATPKGTMVIQHWLEREVKNRNHLILDYNVPLKDGKTIRVKAVNWPRVFFMPPISPCRNAEKPREKLLELLTAHPVPPGIEQKYSNTITFFDYVKNRIQKAKRKAQGG
jgi:hypothetical protein